MNKLLKNTEQNPFYGMSATMALREAGGKDQVTDALLNAAWKEATTEVRKQLFHLTMFDSGSIANRTPYMLGTQKIDNGGESKNLTWMVYLRWLIKNQPNQFIKFLPLIVEYVGLRELTALDIRTKKGTKTIVSTWGLLADIQSNKEVYAAFIELLASMYNSPKVYQNWLLAKHLSRPELGKRIKKDKKTGKVIAGGRALQPVTFKAKKQVDDLWRKLSERLSLEVVEFPTDTKYVGLNEFRKKFNGNLESVLFATQKIKELDREQFLVILESAPAGARYNIRRRLMTGEDAVKEKWNAKFAQWFKEWESLKEQAQQVQRTLVEKEKTVGLTLDEQVKLETVKKEAKVTVGGESLFNMIEKLVAGRADNTLIQSIMDKVQFDVNVGLIIDNSGSMSGLPIQLAKLAATIILLKNPSPTKANWFIKFGTNAVVLADNEAMAKVAPNRFMEGQRTAVGRIIDRTQSFQENFKRISNLNDANMGGTSLSGISQAFKAWVNSPDTVQNSAQKIEEIQNIPVFLLISDGDLNSMPSEAASLIRFQQEMRQWFGWDGVTVIWDIPKSGNYVSKSKNFENIPNVIHYFGFNAGIINQIFTQISDIQPIDTYTSLQSLFQSNRYEAVKRAVL